MYSRYKKNRIIKKLEKIDENNIFIEKNQYNEYNQISIMKKLCEIYERIINKFLI